MTNIETAIAALEERLRAVAVPERAEREKRYLKSDLEFWGATVWQIRAAVKAIARDRPMNHDELVSLVEAVWSEPVHERRMAAIMFLEHFADRLSVDDLRLIEQLIRDSGTWALVDALAGDVVGGIVEGDPVATVPLLDRWATDGDFWVRRSSLLGELQAISHGAPLDHLPTADAQRLMTAYREKRPAT